MVLVDRLNSGQRQSGFVQVPEAEETLGMRQEAAFARVLDDGRLAAGQVAEGPVADPCVCEGHADRLRAAELSPRPLDVCAVLLRRRAHLPGLADLPPEGFQTRPPMFVLLGQADGQLKPYGRPGREVLIFQERDVL